MDQPAPAASPESQPAANPPIDGPLAPPVRHRYWGLILRAVVSIALVTLLATRIDAAGILAAIRGLRWELWGLGLVFLLVSQTFSALRWCGLARGLGFEASVGQFIQWYLEGMFFSLCLPSSIGGDVMKVYRLAPHHPYHDVTPSGIRPDAGYSSTIKTAGRTVLAGCTVLADRATGLLALTCLGLTAFLQRIWELPWSTAVALGVGLFVLEAVAVWLATRALTLAPWLLARQPRLSRLFDRLRPFADRPGVLLKALVWSLAVQFTNVFSVVCVGMAMGLDVPLGGYFVAVPVVAVATTLPLSINGVGLREGGYALLLAPYGLTNESSVTLGLLHFLVILTSGLIGGLAFMLRGKGHPHAAEPTPEGAAALK